MYNFSNYSDEQLRDELQRLQYADRMSRLERDYERALQAEIRRRRTAMVRDEG